MNFFKVLADAAEENSKIQARAIGLVHRTHNGILEATGINSILPTSVRNFSDGMFRTHQQLALDTGTAGANVLRNIGYV